MLLYTLPVMNASTHLYSAENMVDWSILWQSMAKPQLVHGKMKQCLYFFLVFLYFNLSNTADMPEDQSLRSDAVHPNIVQTLPKIPNIPSPVPDL